MSGADARSADAERSPSEALADLIELLELEPIDRNFFRGQNEKDRPGRLFGGQVAGQALMAASLTVDDIPAHSLHGYFLRAGDPSVPVLYVVDRIRDGRSFTTRRVVAQQHGRAIFNMSVSFHAAETGYEHAFPIPSDVPPPERTPTLTEHVEANAPRIPEELRRRLTRVRPIDTRHVDAPIFMGGAPREGPGAVWFKAIAPLPDDPKLHQCVLTYASDFSLLDHITRPHGRKGPLGPLMTASLDHAIWFHRETRVDDWLLYHQDSPAAFGARGLGRGTIYRRDGTLVASVAQEALIRPVQTDEDRSQ